MMDWQPINTITSAAELRDEMRSELRRLRAENERLKARVACFKDCSAGVHLDMEAGCVSVCKSPEECQGWRAYLPALGKDDT